MSGYPVTWREIAEMWREWALERKNAVRIMRKADFRPASGEGAAPTPILSLEGSRRFCFAAAPYPSRAGNFAIDADGRVWAWGINTNNRWGRPVDELGVSTPGTYPSPYGLDASGTALSANEFTTDVLQEDGSVLTSSEGPDGAGNTGAPFVTLSAISDVVAVASNQYQTNAGAHFYLKDDGTIWARGEGIPGAGLTVYGLPTQLSTTQTGTDVVEIAAATFDLAFRKSSGAVKVWRGGGILSESTAREPSGLPSDVVKISAGGSHVAVLTDSGEIWVTGDNGHGQYGDGTSFSGGTLEDWHQADGDGYTDVASTGDNLVAIKDGSLWTWGSASSRLGLGETPNLTDKTTPEEVTFPAYSDYVSVHGYNLSSNFLAVRDSGCMMIWGVNGPGDSIGGYLGRGYFGGVADQPEEVLVSKAYPPWPEV